MKDPVDVHNALDEVVKYQKTYQLRNLAKECSGQHHTRAVFTNAVPNEIPMYQTILMRKPTVRLHMLQNLSPRISKVSLTVPKEHPITRLQRKQRFLL